VGQPLVPASHGSARASEVRSRPTGPRPPATARSWAALLVAGWLFQAGLRAWLSRGLTVPLANPDEAAYLISARVLAGGPGANFSHSTLYPAGYPLLITPVFLITHNAATAYRAVLMINALISSLLMPLAFAACRRLNLDRRLAYGVAMVTALLPAGLFYSEFALTDAIFPVLMLAWLLTVHTWLTASTTRGQFLAAFGSALLAGYSYAVHSRGMVIIAAYIGFGLVVLVRRLVPRESLVIAALTLLVTFFAGWALDRHLSAVMYPQGARSLSGEAITRLRSVHGTVLVLEMAAGQMWRLVLDSWGVAALGMVAAIVVLVRRDGSGRWPGAAGRGTEARIMAALAVAVTLGIAVSSPAALPPSQPQTWASGRYLDCMVVTFFLPGMVVLLRAGRRRILAYAACAVPTTTVAAVAVDAYAGSSLPMSGFGASFGFGEIGVLTQDWTEANVAMATLAGFVLLAAWVAVAVLLPGCRWTVLAALAAVSLVAVVQLTQQVTQPASMAQRASVTGLFTGGGLRPGQQIAMSTALGWQVWMPQAVEINWTSPEFFNPAQQPPPPNAVVVEVPWLAGQRESATWPQAPRGWRIVASYDGPQAGDWVAWRAPAQPTPAAVTAPGAGLPTRASPVVGGMHSYSYSS
jgi:hypothetical protein